MSTWSSDYRAIEYWPDRTDTRVIFAVKRTPENDQKSDEELIAEFEPWRIKQQFDRDHEQEEQGRPNLRAVEDPE
jgi:hypothetical protein